MPQASIFSFDTSHIGFADYTIALINKLRINYIAIGHLKKHSHPRIIFHNGLNVSEDRSPKTKAKIPGKLLFTTVQTQSFFYQRKFVTHQFEQLRECLGNPVPMVSYFPHLLPNLSRCYDTSQSDVLFV